MIYFPSPDRYKNMQYRRCGKGGLKLPAVSLGLWHNFGGVDAAENFRKILHMAFDSGITHFDLANNYGPPPGSAERGDAADGDRYRSQAAWATWASTSGAMMRAAEKSLAAPAVSPLRCFTMPRP